MKKVKWNTIQSYLEKFIYFFPIQLLLVHFKRNLLLLALWLMLFGFISQQIGVGFGVPNLFLSPEYFNDVNFLSFLIMGFSVGGFIMAFHIYSYVTFGPHFQFIATLSRPFFKFCINNSTIPLLFIILHCFKISQYQAKEELSSVSASFLYVLGYLIGIFFFIAVSIFYFFITNKDLFKISGKNEADFDNESKTIQTVFSKKYNWEKLFTRKKEYRVDYYIGGYYKIKKARDSDHYDAELLRKVFAQNHLNISLFEIAIIATFIILGSFREVPFFMVPAGASVMVLFTMLVMIYSALFSWLKGWTLFVLILVFFGFNYLSTVFDINQYKNFAYGLDYNIGPADYSKEKLLQLNSDTTKIFHDKELHYEMLNNWHNKIYESTGNDKPYFIVVNTSGGGLRSAYWTFLIMRELQKETGEKFMSHLNFITGASGGMIGAAYFREIYYKHTENEDFDIYNERYLENLGKYLLNHVSFTIATNDLIVRYQTFKDGKQTYPKDRGYAFEWQLNQNTENLMNKRLEAYRYPEFEGRIPMMIFTPTIINDGRRLVISSQPLGFLTSNYMFNDKGLESSLENVEYKTIFADHNPGNLRFTTALRMNATFPYILPMVSMPSHPRMDVMDAGIRDNYGTKLTWRYLYSLRDWILKHTKGVIYVKIRDNKKDFDIQSVKNYSVIDRLARPFGNFYANFPRTQDYDHDELTLLGKEWLGDKLNQVTFYLKESPHEPIALSWHLTKREKKAIMETLKSDRIRLEFEKIKSFFESGLDD